MFSKTKIAFVELSNNCLVWPEGLLISLALTRTVHSTQIRVQIDTDEAVETEQRQYKPHGINKSVKSRTC